MGEIQAIIQKRSGDPNPQYFPKVLPYKWGRVLPYKWEAYCSTNGRCIAGCPFLRSLDARKARRYKWGAYCRTNWRCTAVLFGQVVGVGVSETLPNYGNWGSRMKLRLCPSMWNTARSLMAGPRAWLGWKLAILCNSWWADVAATAVEAAFVFEQTGRSRKSSRQEIGVANQIGMQHPRYLVADWTAISVRQVLGFF